MTSPKGAEALEMRVIELIGYIAGAMGPHLAPFAKPNWKYLEKKFADAIREAERQSRAEAFERAAKECQKLHDDCFPRKAATLQQQAYGAGILHAAKRLRALAKGEE